MASVVVACVALDDAGVADDDGVTTGALCAVTFVDGDAAGAGEVEDAGSDVDGGEVADVVTGADALGVDEAMTGFAVEGVAVADCAGVSEPPDAVPLAPGAMGLGSVVGAPDDDARCAVVGSPAEVRDVASPECCRVYS